MLKLLTALGILLLAITLTPAHARDSDERCATSRLDALERYSRCILEVGETQLKKKSSNIIAFDAEGM